MGTMPRDAFRRSLGPLYDFLEGALGVIGRGRTIYVDSATGSNDANHGSSWDAPLASLDYAIGTCQANSGDVILLAPNHAETITGAGGITADVAGITIVGLGSGDQRPRFLMDGGTTVDFVISAADVTVRNCVFAAGHADIVRCFAISATGAWIDQCEFVDDVVNENFLTEIKAISTTDNNANDLKVTNCRAFTPDANAVEFIEINADLNGLVAMDNFVCKDAATAGKFILCATGKDLTNCDIERNRHVCGMTAGDVFVDNDTTANSGVIADNRVGHHDTAGVVLIDCDGVRLFQNFSASEDTTSALLRPAADDDT